MNRTFWLVGAAALAILHSPVGAQDDKGPVQWIVASAPAFSNSLTPLCERRRAEGMRVVMVKTTDILSPQQLENGEAGPLKDHIVDLCKKHKGPSYVLLVGAVASKDPAIFLPPLRGTTETMKGQPSDNAYGAVNNDLMPSVAVGRFPANTVDEARQMVKKTLAFEQAEGPDAWRNRLTLIVGNPGGASVLEKRGAEYFVQTIVKDRFARLVGSPWTTRAVVLTPSSPYFVAENKVRDLCLRYLEDGQLFSVYLGHSSPGGFWSGLLLDNFISRDDWAKRDFPGIFFSCGCNGCQLKEDDEGYGLAAMRNPRGPVAVIGAHGTSHSVMGQFAIDGLLECLTRPKPPQRLGDYWLGITKELATGKIDDLTFWLYDQADGSKGKVSLANQRREHLEMWMLLGDPALRLPLRLPTIRLEASGPAVAGKAFKVRGSLPADFQGTSLRLILERPMGSPPPALPPLPKEADLIMARHEQANSLAIATRDVQAKDGSFEAEFQLPKPLPWPCVVVRALAATKEQSALGVLTLTPEP